MITPEDILLRYSRRGMDILRPCLPPDYCRRAAADILSWPRGRVLLTTGFYVAGHAETDGPAGTLALALALAKLGFCPVAVTDDLCRGFFEPEGLETVYMDLSAGPGDCAALLARLAPVGLISVERCGVSAQGDYANMRGVSIRAHTPRLDLLFDLARGVLPTVGVGDGGNEIGMGNLAGPIRESLRLVPCRVRTDHLVIATVSNWGAYGLAACLEGLSGRALLPDFRRVRAFLERTVALGSVDGISGRPALSVDGFGLAVEEEICRALGAWARGLPLPAPAAEATA